MVYLVVKKAKSYRGKLESKIMLVKVPFFLFFPNAILPTAKTVNELTKKISQSIICYMLVD